QELIEPRVTEMQPDHCIEGTCTYRGTFTTDEAGLYGFAVRVVPRHDDLTSPMDLGLLTLA
ncbi:MAG: hypothetical protein M3161_07100, partial [Actinomycetota bacterium]|nr:hypothetical protein [Actinomycetota bacterium]